MNKKSSDTPRPLKESVALTVDFSDLMGEIRPLHSVNMGPISLGGVIDLSEHHRELGFPLTRTHDALFGLPGAIDVHCVFPLFDADPEDPANYTFGLSDDYVKSIIDVGSKVYYRLGETIEHHRIRKHYSNPPKDFDKWARICVNIVRHYNEGWADGFHHDIQHWEIWNEASNPPCWTGTMEDYYRLYETAVRALKAHNPKLKVGGPATGDYDGIANDPFGRGFLDYVRARDVPLDFYSWHAYPDHPAKILQRGLAARKYLDDHGFSHVESHLNEWNLSSYGWDFMTDLAGLAERTFANSSGPQGAAFIAGVLTLLQDAGVDEAHFYWGREGWWGLFDPYCRPLPNFYAFLAFKKLIDLAPRRVRTNGGDPATGLTALAGISGDDSAAAILLSNFDNATTMVDLSLHGPWQGATDCEVALVDDQRRLDVVSQKQVSMGSVVQIPLPAGTVCLVTLRKNSLEKN